MSDPTSTITATTTPARHLDHVAFRDWMGMRTGLYVLEERDGLLLLELHQRSVLRVVHAWSREPAPVTVAELLVNGRRLTTQIVGTQRLPRTLGEIARGADGRRLGLEAELQRRRLFPLFRAWFDDASGEGNGSDVRNLDIFVLRFRDHATFGDFALLAEWAPAIGGGLLHFLFRSSEREATRLLTRWAARGEWARLRHVAEAVERLTEELLAGSPNQRAMRVVAEGLARHRAGATDGAVD